MTCRTYSPEFRTGYGFEACIRKCTAKYATMIFQEQINHFSGKEGRTGYPIFWNVVSAILCSLSGAGMLLLCHVRYSSYVPAFLFGLHVLFLADYTSAAGVHHSLFCRISASQDTKERGAELVSALSVSCAASCCTAGVIVLFARLLYTGSFRTVAISVACFLPLYGMNKILLSYANSLELFGTLALGKGIRYVLSLGTFFLFSILGIDGSLALLCFAGGEIVLFIFLLGKFYREIVHVSFSMTYMHRHLSFGWKTAGSDMILDWNVRAGILLLPLFNSGQTGMYSLAILILDGMHQITGTARTIFSPGILSAFRSGRACEIRLFVRKAILVSLCLSAGTGTAFFIAAHCATGLFPAFIGEMFGGIIPYIGVLFPAFVLFTVVYPFVLVLPAAGYPGKFALFLLLVTIAHMILLASLLPIYGVSGAVFSLAAYFVMLSAVIALAAFAGMKIFRRERAK